MYVCVCKAITDKQIQQAVADGATNFRAVRDQLGAATQCGSCATMTRELIDEYQADLSPKNFYQVA